ncbi:hypothetical protein Kisp01_72770 [Kineosporia sp. NBRC 101677]|nr:hypothetical protein Kisp01_72770 [Kineosporia sp. NBRC 101677]
MEHRLELDPGDGIGDALLGPEGAGRSWKQLRAVNLGRGPGDRVLDDWHDSPFIKLLALVSCV